MSKSNLTAGAVVAILSLVGFPLSAIGYIVGWVCYSFMLGFNSATSYINKGIEALEGVRK